MARDQLSLCTSSQYEGQDLEALADLPRYHRWILKTFQPFLQGRSLEIGAGIGNFASRYIHQVEESVLLEPAKNLVPQLEARFDSQSNVQVVPGLLEDWCENRLSISAPPLASFDTIVLVNVLEHVEDHLAMVQTIHDLLRPGGSMLLFVPAVRWLYGTLDRKVHHYRRYTRSGIRRLCKATDLDLVHLRYFDVLGVLPWLLSGRVLKQNEFNPLMARIYDRLIVPVGSFLERWLSAPIGKNLICVARRPIQASEELSVKRAA